MAPAKARHSPGWVVDPGNPLGLVPVSPGTVQGTLTVPRAGRFDLWLEGSFGRGYTVSVDGRRIGAVAYALNGREESELVATLQLAAGRHGVTLVRAGGDLRPGNALDPRVGPLAVVPAGEPEPVRTVAPAAARRWCGRALDWIEVVRPA
jgi:hypothetical protein